jgi:hypothetical protein
MKIAIATAALLIALASSAIAQPSMSPPQPAVPAPQLVDPPLSEQFALGLSLGLTAGSWALVVGSVYATVPEAPPASLFGLGLLGTYLAPSTGHWYAGSFLTRGLVIRSVGAVAAFSGFVKAISCETCDENNVLLLFWGGLALYAVGTIDDIVTAPGRVRRKNRALGYTIAPVVTPSSTGVMLGGRF